MLEIKIKSFSEIFLGCDASVSDFGRHLASAHPLDDKTTAQTRYQILKAVSFSTSMAIPNL